jgi:predicted ArsR family transcriptional regulator
MQAEKNAKPPTRASGAWGGNGETLAQVMQVLSNNDEWTAAKVAEVCRVAKTTTYRHLENLVAKGLAEKREHQFAGQGSATALYRLKGTPQGTPDTEARLRVAPALRALMISEGPVTVRQAMKATGFAESGIRSAITRMVSAGEVVCKKGDRRLKVYSLAEE